MKTKNEKAIEQLKYHDIDCHEENGLVYVDIGIISLELSEFEVDFRAKLYDEQKANGRFSD